MHHRFFTATAGLLLGITLIGFSPSFFLKFVFEHPGGLCCNCGRRRLVT